MSSRAHALRERDIFGNVNIRAPRLTAGEFLLDLAILLHDVERVDACVDFKLFFFISYFETGNTARALFKRKLAFYYLQTNPKVNIWSILTGITKITTT